MLELQREGASKDRVQQAEAQERHGGGLVGAKTAEAIVAISTTSLAAVWNGYSNAEGGYNKEWHLEFGGTMHVTRDGTGMTDYTPAEPGSTQEISGETFVPFEGFGYIDVITRPQGGNKT